MKCALCDRELTQAAHWVGGLAIGPKCYAKRFGTVTRIKTQVIKNQQEDLFNELCTNRDESNSMGAIPKDHPQRIEPSANTQSRERDG